MLLERKNYTLGDSFKKKNADPWLPVGLGDYEKTFQSNRNVLYLDGGKGRGSYTGVHI